MPPFVFYVEGIFAPLLSGSILTSVTLISKTEGKFLKFSALAYRPKSSSFSEFLWDSRADQYSFTAKRSVNTGSVDVNRPGFYSG